MQLTQFTCRELVSDKRDINGRWTYRDSMDNNYRIPQIADCPTIDQYWLMENNGTDTSNWNNVSKWYPNYPKDPEKCDSCSHIKVRV